MQHRDYQQLASRVAELSATLQAMEAQLQTPASDKNHQSSPANQSVVETQLAIAAG
jgi:hypothetical protein